ncbi:hypothetical protein LZ31DRAFT_377158 [Colletotrichum somersetense]|nr:hypothetical protein LZ31DRAFT_377158 [Colletotrichum somersetense]
MNQRTAQRPFRSPPFGNLLPCFGAFSRKAFLCQPQSERQRQEKEEEEEKSQRTYTTVSTEVRGTSQLGLDRGKLPKPHGQFTCYPRQSKAQTKLQPTTRQSSTTRNLSARSTRETCPLLPTSLAAWDGRNEILTCLGANDRGSRRRQPDEPRPAPNLAMFAPQPGGRGSNAKWT